MYVYSYAFLPPYYHHDDYICAKCFVIIETELTNV